MEILIVLLLLALCEKNSELKETLQSALKFYRENRDLLMSLSPSAQTEEPTPQPKSEKADSSADSLKLIEQFLKRQ